MFNPMLKLVLLSVLLQGTLLLLGCSLEESCVATAGVLAMLPLYSERAEVLYSAALPLAIRDSAEQS